jgi:hypothetical protein
MMDRLSTEETDHERQRRKPDWQDRPLGAKPPLRPSHVWPVELRPCAGSAIGGRFGHSILDLTQVAIGEFDRNLAPPISV